MDPDVELTGPQRIPTIHLLEVIVMKNRIAKSIVAVAATSLLLASLGVSAATTHKCAKGQKWDTKTSTCVATPTKPAN